MELRNYQKDEIEKVRSAFKRGKKRVLAVLPCGAGKTVLFAYMSSKNIQLSPSNRVLFLVHRKELVDQTVNTFTRFGLMDPRIQVSMVQSLANKVDKIEKPSLIVVDECYDGDTEILTENGFVKFSNLDKNVRVAQYNGNGKVDFVKPIRYIEKETNEVINFNYNDININVTPNHNMVCLNKKGKIVTKRAVEFVDLKSNDYSFITKAVFCENEEQTLTALDRIKIMVQADGCLYHKHKTTEYDTFKLEFSKERKIERFKYLCEQANVKYTEYRKRKFENAKWKDSYKFTIHLLKEKNNYKLLSSFLEIPRNQKYARDILDEVKYWDGHITEDRIEYDSVIEENVQFVQLCAFAANSNCSIPIMRKRRSVHNDIYRVYYDKQLKTNYERFKVSKIAKAQKMYCVEVPSHMLVVRKDNFIFVCGNCHHSTSMTYKKIINKFPTVPLIGLTATPCRLDGKGLGEIFEDMEIGVTAKWLVQNGYLCQYDYYAPKINLQDAKFTTKMGDYDTTDVSKKLDEAGIYGDVMKYFDPSKKTIIYAPSLELSKKMTAIINEKYPNLARHFDGDTPKKERQEIVEKFRSGEIRCLCNRDLIGEGFDVPDCDCCMLLRPTKSVSLYIQQAMRCMRPNGNKRAVIYDFVGNCYRHGLPDDDREWNLQGKIKCKNENAEEGVTCRTCKNCFRVYAGSSPTCPYCGFNNGKTPKEIKQDEEKELERIVALEAKKKKRQEGMCRSLDDFLKLAEERGYKPGWAYQRAKIRGYI